MDRSEVFEDEFATTKASEGLRVGVDREEVGGGAMLLCEASFDGLRVGVEGCYGSRGGLGEEAWGLKAKKRGPEGGEERGSVVHWVFHDCESAGWAEKLQCRKSHSVSICFSRCN
jgi:hypothetical protein